MQRFDVAWRAFVATARFGAMIALGIIFALLALLSREAAAEPSSWPCRGRCIDAAILWHTGFAQFFKGDKYWRYDVPSRRVEIGYDFAFPRPIRDWSWLPQGWWSGIDTAFNDGNGKVYFFKGREYVRLDMVTARVDVGPLPIAGNWPGLPSSWTSGFDAAVNWGGGKVYFFKGHDYLVYDLAENKAAAPRPIAGNLRGLPETWASGIDSAVNWGDGKVYLFKADQYVRYNIASNTADGVPRSIATDWAGLMPLIEWTPGPVTEMPRLGMKVGRESDGRDIFLCTAKVGNTIYAGRTWAKARACRYLDGEREQSADAFAIAATALPIEWQLGDSVPSFPLDRLVPIGMSSAGRAYYLCRVRSAGAVYPGWFADQAQGCTIAQQGRARTVRDNMEIAFAPTAVNFPYVPYPVKMFNPIAGSERFKNVCAAEVVYDFRDAAAGARIPRDLPDMRSMIQTASRNSCAMLYKDPSEVPKYARKVIVVIETNRENDSDGFVDRSASSSTMTLQARMFPSPAPETRNILVTLINHEITHTTQGTNNQFGAFTEGMADVVLLRLWERHDRKAGGHWLDGYANMAYFFIWLDERYPGFVYKFNRWAGVRNEVGSRTFREITGKSIDELWQEYQLAVVSTRALPESRLQWSRGGDARGSACELTVHWDDNFAGDSFRTTQDHLRLSGGWNDQISSIVITSGVWQFFEHDEFGGKVLKLGPGRYPRLGDRGWNDQISSFRCLDRGPSLHGWPATGCEVTVYWDDNFDGKSLRTTHDLMRLRDGWNDQISSIAVTAGIWQFFEDDAYGGEARQFGPGHYPHLDGWNDRISSLRCIEPAPWAR